MLIKAGVDISRLSRNARRALQKCSEYIESKNDEIIVTSTCEGTHSAGSLHYSNDAFDLRIPEVARSVIMTGLPDLLGDDYDIVFYLGHIHVEYDPK